jgi:hypothetical protein
VRARSVAQKSQARVAQLLRAQNIELMEKVNEELAARNRATCTYARVALSIMVLLAAASVVVVCCCCRRACALGRVLILLGGVGVPQSKRPRLQRRGATLLIHQPPQWTSLRERVIERGRRWRRWCFRRYMIA